MKQLKWYFKNGTKYETFSVIYEDETFMLVRNENSRKLSFGARNCFGTFYGFPANWSCLRNDEAIALLSDLCDIVSASEKSRTAFCGMLNALTEGGTST